MPDVVAHQHTQKNGRIVLTRTDGQYMETIIEVAF